MQHKIDFRSTLALTVLITALFSPELHAKRAYWPPEVLLKYPLVTVIGPERPDDFARTYGVYSPVRAPKKRTQFGYVSLGPTWHHKLSCTESIRPHGYIHTTALTATEDQRLRIQIPILFTLHGYFQSQFAKDILDWPILKIQVLKLDASTSPKTLIPIHTQYVAVSNFTEQQPDKSNTIQIDFNSAYTTDAFFVSKETNYRIRVEWSADKICNEQQFLFSIGDQLRIVREP